MSRLALLAVVLSGCDLLFQLDHIHSDGGGGGGDGGDAGPVGEWQLPRLIAGVNVPGDTSGALETDPSMTGDLLEIFFSSDRSGGEGELDIYHAKRDSPTELFGPPQRVPELSDAMTDTGWITSDGLAFYETRESQGRVSVARRQDRGFAFTQFFDEPQLSSLPMGSNFELSGDGLQAVGTAPTTSVSEELYIFSRAAPTALFGAPRWIDEVVSPALDGGGTFDQQGLTMIFHSERGGRRQLYMATRINTGAQFDTPTLIQELSSYTASDPWLSPDGRTLVFMSVGDLYITTR